MTQFKKIAAGAVAAAALGSALFGVGAGVAQAKPGHGNDDIWLPGDPPGHNPFGPPGQIKGGPGPLAGPPGHWGDPVRLGLPPVWRPWNWVDLGIRDPQPLVWNPGSNSWGIWWNGLFIGYAA
ncbi:hypothetical protein MJO55_20900 [Mycolicibacterium rufum]|uniref:Uncharacterized protein n=1 Tax=Mycolicibacterium rufum TaxID=318424 RepID=A0A9X2YGT1_9MYCO|nr:hypothetical protein [Mycolicibacterium rufum]KGI69479.1 hypothetical protein EU78_20845 [Mycolicibacterium rufum]MCV7073657.1 hypothetical protein [Mycolicibacterium rufum]ULP35687.1 hypothetical protein MJO55_20900 [Mycolicibacterium rufum]